MLVLLIIFIFVATISFYWFFKRERKSCIGKSCNTEGCCDLSLNQKCVNGVCCSAECESCTGFNGCGESCSQLLCSNEQICYQENCCTPDCTTGSCNYSCGVQCPCPSPNDTCINSVCCTPNDCNDNSCGTDSCGVTCTCQDQYCSDNNCCNNGQCTYENICESNSDPNFNNFLQSWAGFCSQNENGQYQCKNCSYENAQFVRVGNNISIIPSGGTINCVGGCLYDGNYTGPQTIDINSDVANYTNQNGILSSGSIDGYCNGKCEGCLCATDADCLRWGCDGYSCVGSECTKSS